MGNFTEILADSALDALMDTLQVIPFLLVTYLILEYIEHRMSNKTQSAIKKTGSFGPLIGSALGIIPQCGFSSAASTFYAGRVITIGTLFAVYLSTSDEMIPIFIAGKIPIVDMLIILVIKFVIGVVVGFVIDGFMRLLRKNSGKNYEQNFEIHKLCKREHCSCDGNCSACKDAPKTVYEAYDLDGEKDSHGHVHDHSNVGILKPAIIHTVQITLFIFIITFLLNILIELSGGEDALGQFVNANKYTSVIASALVGLVPNCAASVVISQLYVDGVLGFGALIAGLLSATGVGLIVLFRSNRPFVQNILIVLALFAIALILGLFITVIYA